MNREFVTVPEHSGFSLQGVVCEHNDLGTLIFLAAVCG